MLSAILTKFGIAADQFPFVCVIVDKLDKIGADAVVELLVGQVTLVLTPTQTQTQTLIPISTSNPPLTLTLTLTLTPTPTPTLTRHGRPHTLQARHLVTG